MSPSLAQMSQCKESCCLEANSSSVASSEVIDALPSEWLAPDAAPAESPFQAAILPSCSQTCMDQAVQDFSQCSSMCSDSDCPPRKPASAFSLPRTEAVSVGD